MKQLHLICFRIERSGGTFYRKHYLKLSNLYLDFGENTIYVRTYQFCKRFPTSNDGLTRISDAFYGKLYGVYLEKSRKYGKQIRQINVGLNIAVQRAGTAVNDIC